MTFAVLALLVAAFPNANLYGTGDRAVILAHGGQFDRKSWQPQASELVKAGFRVMTIDFEGAPDILAAAHYLRKNGAKTVSVVGASMGGDYAIEGAEAEPAAFDRIVLLGAGAYSPLIKMKGPKLYIVARDDANDDGPRLPNIKKQYDKTVEPKKLIVLKGAAHAQFLFQTDQGARVMSEILRFLSASRPTP